MILRLAAAEIRNRPGRAAFLLAGYALGVAVMVVLLAVGEAMLTQAQNKELLGGGDIVVVSAGVSTEMLQTGGVGSLVLGIPNARFVQRSLLESPRARAERGIAAASPIVDGQEVQLMARGRAWEAIATGEIPSRAAAAGAAARLLEGRWDDSDADRRWAAPSQAEVLREIDHFHQPHGAAVDSSWAEWHYFNVVLEDGRWIYLTLSVGGRIGEPGRWGGGVLLTVRQPNGEHRSLTSRVEDTAVRMDTLSPDLALGGIGSVRLEGETYVVNASAGGARVDLRVTPAPGRYFPPTDVGGSAAISGYVAPALYATAQGTVCLPRCETVRAAQAYHDHNWGVWLRGGTEGAVTWEWGSASDSAVSLLYGMVRGDSTATEAIFAYVVDGRGARGVYRPQAIEWLETQPKAVSGATLRVPRRFRFEDPRQGFRVTVDVTGVHATDQNRRKRRWFIQMRGVATVEERGRVIGRLPGFFETYVD